MDGMELGPPDSMAELCKQASNQSIDFGLTCTSLTEKLKFLKPILNPSLTTQGPGIGSDEEQLNLTTISAVNVELEASGTSAASEATVYQREDESNMDKLIVLTIIIVFTVIGNLGVVLAILLRRGKVTRMYFFILHLSIADLLTAIGTLLPEFIWTFTSFPDFHGGNVGCKIIKYLFMVGPYLSSYTLVMTAVDRYQAICHPLSNLMSTHRRSIQKSHMLAMAWFLAIVLSIPQLYVFHGKSPLTCRADFIEPWGKKAYVIYYSLLNFFIPFIILLFCYSKMCAVLWGNFKQKKEQEKAHTKAGTTSPIETCVATDNKTNKRGNSLEEEDEDFSPEDDEDENNHENGFETIELNEVGNMDAIEPVKVAMPASKRTTRFLKSPFKGGRKKKQRREGSNEGGKMRVDLDVSHPGNGHLMVASSSCPRSHSTRAISKAKIKTVKLTIVVVVGYLICSAPYVCIQLYASFSNPTVSMITPMKWLFWLLCLNSAVNPWIYLAFNPELIPFCQRSRRRSGSRSREMELNSRYNGRNPEGKVCTVRYKNKQQGLDESCVAIQRFTSEVEEAKSSSPTSGDHQHQKGGEGTANKRVAIRVTKTYIDAVQDDGENALEPTETITVM